MFWESGSWTIPAHAVAAPGRLSAREIRACGSHYRDDFRDKIPWQPVCGPPPRSRGSHSASALSSAARALARSTVPATCRSHCRVRASISASKPLQLLESLSRWISSAATGSDTPRIPGVRSSAGRPQRTVRARPRRRSGAPARNHGSAGDEAHRESMVRMRSRLGFLKAPSAASRTCPNGARQFPVNYFVFLSAAAQPHHATP